MKLLLTLLLVGTAFPSLFAESAPATPYVVTSTGQTKCYGDSREIAPPAKGKPYYGQNAQHPGVRQSYRNNNDGTVSDLDTGLMWVKRPDFAHKKTPAEALAGAAACRVGGHRDWRLPTIKELYSLISFTGYVGRDESSSKPFLDTSVFDFAYPDTRKERLIDAQYATSTFYVGKTAFGGGKLLFGVNFADGRIKGYGLVGRRGEEKDFYVRYVRGNPAYGKNDYKDNGDGTVTDRATGLMWQKSDSGKGMDWKDALAYAASLKLAGKSDWRVPDAKELQSIVDYTRAPDADDPAKRGPAIDPVFTCSDPDGWYWTSTTHDWRRDGTAVYVCFGKGWGEMRGEKMDVHGAGCQRSDPKSGDPADFPHGRGPQGDQIRIHNLVRCVRDTK